MERTEATIRQYFYLPDIIDDVCKEVANYDTSQGTRKLNNKYGKLPAKSYEEILWNKLCVDLIRPYLMKRKGKKEKIHIKSVTMIDPVTGWFEILQYEDKRQISVVRLVQTTWLSRYPRPIETTYDQGKEFIGHEFRKYLIEV